ncbi:MAG: hypothetical protein IT327_24015 [Anaerolineae bacterium]|nr:hypothetical protein [Anaerolineae bacterium]
MNDNLFFDFSKLKPNGYHYVAVGFSLPYSLHLPIDSYDIDVEVNLENQSVVLNLQILIENHWKNQKEGRQKFPFAEENSLIERKHDRQATYRYTKVWVLTPIFSEDPSKPKDLNSIWEQVTRTRDWYRNLSIKSVNRFLEIYRYHSKEFHIKPLAGQELWFDFYFAFLFNHNTPQASNSNFTTKIMPISYWGDIYPQLNNVPNIVISNIQTQLKSPQEVPLAESLLLNAYDYFDQGEYRLAVIEAETAFEAAIHQHLRIYFYDNLDSFSEAETNAKNFTNLIKSKFCRPAFGGKIFHDETAEFKTWRSKVMDLRNNLVHAKINTVTKKEAQDAIQTIDITLNHLIARPKTDLHQLL